MYDSNNYSYENGSFTPDPPKTPKKSGGAAKAVAAVLAIAIIGGASGYGGAYLASKGDNRNTIASSETESKDKSSSDNSDKTDTDSVASAPANNNSANAAAAEILTQASNNSSDTLTTKDVIKKVTPSVVSITSKFSSGTSAGTGIIISTDGYIVTNAHVIEAEVNVPSQDSYNNSNDPFSSFFGNYYGNYTTTVQKSDDITITDSDGKEYKATVIGSDTNSDLAVLKIDATGLTAAEIGTSKNLELGDKAITLGYPLALGLSASDGIISGLDKEMTIEVSSGSATMTLIQTDAAINPGNSGGPLLNAGGQVIGITSSKIVSSSVDGVGFAIPIDDAMPILEELMTTGKVKNTVPKIGITGTPITAAVKRYYSLPVDSGVLVASVEAGSAAEKAGIAEGDVIVAADGEEVSDMDALIKIKNKHKAGETMTLTIARSSGNTDVELVLDVDE